LLEIRDLKVKYAEKTVLRGIDLTVGQGETVAVVGESGTGKTSLGLSVMRLLDGSVAGSIRMNGRELLKLSDREMQTLRWNEISMVFQNVNNALNPVYRVLNQVMEPVLEHRLGDETEARAKAEGLLDYFGYPPDRFTAYPHELSSGEQQRVLLAMALTNEPEVLILDEPLSSLDSATRTELAGLLKDTGRDHTVLIFTHDLDIVAELADRVAVLYGGGIVELGPCREVLSSPRHPYTRALIRAYPGMRSAKDLQGIKGDMTAQPPAGCPFYPRCTQAIDICREERPTLTGKGHPVACHRGGIVKLLRIENGTKTFGSKRVVDGVDLDLMAGETLALVGQSGSGKTTLAKIIMGLCEASAGELYLEGEVLGTRGKDFYRRVQMVFQNPGETLSHRLAVLQTVMEPLEIQGIGTEEEREERARSALSEVELPLSREFLNEYPHHLSGGEIQRVAIARALVLDPQLLVADELTTFLDASIQAKILKLLLSLQEGRGLTLLFITHDMAIARKVSDRIAVMKEGRVIELGPAEEVMNFPRQPFTRRLLGWVSDGSSNHPAVSANPERPS